MTQDFRKQTTELQTVFPFKGKGLINDSTDAGNGIGLATGEALVGWYGVGVNNLDGTPALVGTAQALGTAQADTGMADAAVTFTVGDEPDVLNVHVEGPTTAGTTSVFAIKVALRAI